MTLKWILNGQRLKLSLAVVSIAVIVSLFTWPASPGEASPPQLPICGDDTISNSPDDASGPPDMAQSLDPQQYYTAVVWAEGGGSTNPGGDLLLAYSNITTDTITGRRWQRIVVDTDPDVNDDNLNNKAPTIAFDPVISDVVHVAYTRINDIYYKQCDLSTGTCGSRRLLAEVAGDGFIQQYSLAQVAVITGTGSTTVTVVYQYDDNNLGQSYLRYSYIANGGSGTVNGPTNLTSLAKATFREEKPSAVAGGDALHIVFEVTQGASTEYIAYIKLENSDLGSSKGAYDNIFNLHSTKDINPIQPDIAIYDRPEPFDDILVVVWQVDDLGSPSTRHYLAYNKSIDGGDNWDYDISAFSNEYRYLFEGNGADATNRRSWRTDNNDTDLLRYGLSPAVSLSQTGDNILAHVVWQVLEDDLFNFDIFYSYAPVYSATQVITEETWINNAPAALGMTNGITYQNQLTVTSVTTNYANMTGVYRLGPGDSTHRELDRVRPVVRFNDQVNRLQVAYVSELAGGKLDVYYNGWQLSDGVPYTFDDTDCDWIDDTPYEANPGPSCAGVVVPDGTDFDCDADGIPNFMDADADGDGDSDLDEFIQSGKNKGNLDALYDGNTSIPKNYLPALLKQD
jgi:hypothetical protein